MRKLGISFVSKCKLNFIETVTKCKLKVASNKITLVLSRHLHHFSRHLLALGQHKLTAEMESIARPRASRAAVAKMDSVATSIVAAMDIPRAVMRPTGLKATAVATKKLKNNLNITTTKLTELSSNKVDASTIKEFTLVRTIP